VRLDGSHLYEAIHTEDPVKNLYRHFRFMPFFHAHIFRNVELQSDDALAQASNYIFTQLSIFQMLVSPQALKEVKSKVCLA